MSYISSAAGGREDKNVLLPTVAFASGLAAVFCGLGLSVSLLGGVFGGSGGGAEGSDLSAFLLAGLSSGVSIAMGFQLLELINIPLPSFEFNVGNNGASTSAVGIGGNVDGKEIDENYCEACSQIKFDDDGSIIQAPNTVPATTQDQANDAGSLLQSFLLGGSSALVASPCATPVLTSILAFVGASKDPALGAILLFTYTVGYSTPLLVVAASGGQALVNLQGGGEEDGIAGTIGQLVNPLTASVLIWYGVNGFLTALFGDPSLAGLAPIFD